MRALGLTLVLIAGCGKPSGGPHDSGSPDGPRGRDDADAHENDAGTVGVSFVNASGTRLKVQWVDFAASRTSPAIYDSERGERCEKRLWADGKLYCTPPAYFAPLLNEFGRYSDNQCQSLLAVEGPGEGYYMAIGTQLCGGESFEQSVEQLYRLGPKTLQWYERAANGSCIGPFTDDYFNYNPATLVPRSALVAVEREIDAAPGRLGYAVLTSSDGLRIEDGVYDRTLDLDCQFETEEQLATSARCVPKGHAKSFTYFADAACTRPAYVDDGLCYQPTRARQTLATHTYCALEPEPYRVIGPPVTTGFERSTGAPYACSASTTSSWVFHELGAELPIAQVSRVLDATGPRITPIRDVFDGLAFDDRRLYDRDLGTECTPDTSFGDLRCVPPRWPVKFGYSDAACSTPVRLMPVKRGPTSCAIPKTGAHIATAAQTVYQVGAPYTGQYYEKPSTTCVPRAFASDEAHLEVTQVPASVLATGSVVIDP